MFSISKTIIHRGKGFECPSLTSDCQVTVEVEYPVDSVSFGVDLGKMCSFCASSPKAYCDAILFECLADMKESETSNFVVDFIKTDMEEVKSLKMSIYLDSFTKGNNAWDIGITARITLASSWKAFANDCFSKSNICMAGYWYHKAIFLLITGRNKDDKKEVENLDKLLSTCRLNLAAVQLKRELYQHVISNCSEVLCEDESNVKALYRRAQAHYFKEDTKSAIKDLRLALKIEPNSNSVRNLLTKIISQN